MGLWVSIIIIAAEPDVFETIKSLLQENFKVNGGGKFYMFLRVRIIQSEDQENCRAKELHRKPSLAV